MQPEHHDRPHGTYVALRVLEPCNKMLREHCLKNNIKVDASLFDNRMHTTVIYSRKHHPEIEIIPERKYVAKFLSYDIFTTTEGKNALVVRLDAPGIVVRHKHLVTTYGATYDFPEYHPHITLSYDFDGLADGITPFDFHIILGDEYMEDLYLEGITQNV